MLHDTIDCHMAVRQTLQHIAPRRAVPKQPPRDSGVNGNPRSPGELCKRQTAVHAFLRLEAVGGSVGNTMAWFLIEPWISHQLADIWIS